MPHAVRKLSQSHREAISRGQIARYRRIKDQLTKVPERKKCTTCGEWKAVPDDYTMRKRKLASGETKEYPSGECKVCAAKRAADHRAKLAEEGKLREREKLYNSRRDADHKRRYNREYGAARRRQEGAKARGPWKKYREEGRGGQLPIEPLAIFLEEQVHKFGASAVATAVGMDERRIRAVVEKEYKTISTDLADRILTGLNYPEQMVILYPHA